jgi:glycosyltransferase involved in cell wall biosynthesis
VRVLFFSYYFLPHVGAGTWSTYYLASNLSQLGHKCIIVVPNVQYALSVDRTSSATLEKKLHVTLHRTPIFGMPRKLGPFLSALFLFFTGLRVGRDADVILCQFHPHHFVFVMALFIGKIFQVPVVARANDIYREMGMKKLGVVNWSIKIVNAFNELFVKYADTFLVVNSESKEMLMSRLGKKASSFNICLNRNGVNLSEFDAAPGKKEAKKLLGIKFEERVVLFVGRYSGKEYGIDLLLKAMPNILRDVPNSIVILVGDEMTSHQKELVNSLKIRKNIRVYGPQPRKQIVKFIAAADLCIGPLRPTFATPQKILEYMACGKPIVSGLRSISKDLSPISSMVEVPPEAEAISKAVTKLLKNSDYAEMLGSKARNIVNKFCWKEVANDLEKVLLGAVRSHEEN